MVLALTGKCVVNSFLIYFCFRKSEVELLQSLRFNRERLTYIFTGTCIYISDYSFYTWHRVIQNNC